MGLTYFSQAQIPKDKIEAAWLNGVRLPEYQSQLIDLCVYDPLFVAKLMLKCDSKEDEFIVDHLIHHLAPYAKYIHPASHLAEHQAWVIIGNHRPWFYLVEKHLLRLPKSERIWKEQIHREERVLFEARVAIAFKAS